MPLPSTLTQFTAELPYALKLDLEGYLASVDAARADIYRDAHIPPEEVTREEFLFVTGIWRIWTQVDSQRWIVRNSLQLAGQFGAGSIQAGSVRLARGSEDVEGLRKLGSDLRRWLNRQRLEFIIQADDLAGLLEGLRDRANDAN